MNYKVRIKNSRIKPLQDMTMFCGNAGSCFIEAEFDEMWNGMAKFVIFRRDPVAFGIYAQDANIIVPIDNKRACVPEKVLSSPGRAELGFFATNADEDIIRISSEMIGFDIREGAYTASASSAAAPEADMWELLVAKTVPKIENGTWKTYDPVIGEYTDTGVLARGETGEKGPKGDKGDPGATPCKGVDYFTEEDIEILDIDGRIEAKTDSFIGAFVRFAAKTGGLDYPGIAGLSADFEHNVFSRIGASKSFLPGEDFDIFDMYGKRRRCILDDGGEVIAYYGENGYSENGSLGQVMVEQPKFYYLVAPVKLDGAKILKANYYVSDIPYPGFSLHPAFINENGEEVEKIYYSAYEGSFHMNGRGYINDNEQVLSASAEGIKLCSISGAVPANGSTQPLTRENARSIARNRGEGWNISTIKAESAAQLLMITEYASFDMQSALGAGVAYAQAQSITGSTASLGNSSGNALSTSYLINGSTVSETTQNKLAVSYRGVENPWADLYRFVDGINIWGDRASGGGYAFICSDFDFGDAQNSGNYSSVGFTLPNSNGYIMYFGYSAEYDWIFLPIQCGGTADDTVGDYFYTVPNLATFNVFRIGGQYRSIRPAGPFCYGSHAVSNQSQNHSLYYGARLMYVPV